MTGGLALQELTVVSICGLVGFMVVYVAIDWAAGLKARPSRKSRDGFKVGEDDSASSASGHPNEGTKPWYETLEVDTSSTIEEIKKAYRRKILQYHPDRLCGLAPELRQLAEAR